MMPPRAARSREVRSQHRPHQRRTLHRGPTGCVPAPTVRHQGHILLMASTSMAVRAWCAHVVCSRACGVCQYIWGVHTMRSSMREPPKYSRVRSNAGRASTSDSFKTASSSAVDVGSTGRGASGLRAAILGRVKLRVSPSGVQPIQYAMPSARAQVHKGPISYGARKGYSWTDRRPKQAFGG